MTLCPPPSLRLPPSVSLPPSLPLLIFLCFMLCRYTDCLIWPGPGRLLCYEWPPLLYDRVPCCIHVCVSRVLCVPCVLFTYSGNTFIRVICARGIFRLCVDRCGLVLVAFFCWGVRVCGVFCSWWRGVCCVVFDWWSLWCCSSKLSRPLGTSLRCRTPNCR